LRIRKERDFLPDSDELFQTDAAAFLRKFGQRAAGPLLVRHHNVQRLQRKRQQFHVGDFIAD
jgi:hypothetical protein